MTDSISTAQRDTYNQGFELLAQEIRAVLVESKAVEVTAQKGKRLSKDQVGVMAAREKTTRDTDTTYVDVPQPRRWLSHTSFSFAALKDWADLLDIIEDPGSEWNMAMLASLRREQDASILTAALATAYTGADGTTATAFDTTNNRVAAGGTGMTYDKLRECKRRLSRSLGYDAARDELHMALTGFQEEELMNEIELISSDYNRERLLNDGTLQGKSFYGFKFHVLEDWTDHLSVEHRIVPHDESANRRVVAWVKSGLWHNERVSPHAMFDRMPNKDQAWQHWVGADFGSTRKQEAKVVEVLCVEAP